MKTLTKKLDKLWSEIIRKKGRCEVCGQTTSLNAHHIIGRRFRVTRWDLKNGICLCAGCHTFRNRSAHQDPLWFTEWLKQNKPKVVEHLNDKRWKIKKYTKKELELLYQALKELNEKQ